MSLFELTLLNYLRSSKIKMEITGFDMEAFKNAMYRELENRLGMIEGIIYEDYKTSTDAEKVAAIKLLFDREFYS